MKVAEEERIVAELVRKEVAHARTLLDSEPTYDNIKDAADCLNRAAWRLLPEEYRA